MNKNLVLLLLVLVLLGGGAYAAKTFFNFSAQMPGGKGSLKGLLALGKNVTCNITNPDGTTGTIYVSGETMRGDFTSKSGPDGKDMTSSMIVDNEYTYMWSGKAGTKMKAVKPTPGAAGTATEKTDDTSGDQGASLEEEVALDCKSWSPDRSKFTPPSDVTFQDFSAMMEAQTKAGSPPTGNGMGASLCDQITDPDAKAQCVSAMGGGN